MGRLGTRAVICRRMTSAQTATNIQKWNQVQEELKEGSSAQASVPRVSLSVPNTEELNAHLPNSQVPVLHPSAVSNGLSTVAISDPVEVEFEFSDTIALTCLLCARQFKTNDQLKRHNKESDLHKARFFIPLHVLVFEMGLTIVLFLSCLIARNRRIRIPLNPLEKFQGRESARCCTSKDRSCAESICCYGSRS
jgi:hypothetical protein